MKCLGKSPLGSLRRIWEDNVKMDLKESEWHVDGAT
jgi:hypothetical protein